jgi:hypothetical protein
LFSPPKQKILWKDGGPPLWAKHIGLKGGAIGNTFGEHIGNKGKMKKILPLFGEYLLYIL